MKLFAAKIIALTLLLGTFLTTALAHADIVVVVNNNNPVKALTSNEVKQLFLGRLRNFPGVMADVEIVEQESDAPIFNAFYQHIMQRDNMWIKRYRARYYFSGQGRLPKTFKTQDEVITYAIENSGVATYIQLDAGDPLPLGLKEVYRISLSSVD
ncbi:MAG: hypothetical protein MI976_30180 [Pseudomonadales bacterium]|nr:hypothetical protein [Pseudomonadales bacterium]